MEARIFGRELTNIVSLQNNKPRRAHSFVLNDKPQLIQNNHSINAHMSIRNNSVKEEIIKQEAKKQLSDPQMVPEYISECLSFMRRLEKDSWRPENIANSEKKNVNEKERAKVVDWLSNLHSKYSMFPQTLFTIITIFDNYVRNTNVPLKELQLVGVAALYAAAKFQETYQVPPVSQLFKACKEHYSVKQILNMEANIIKYHDFNLIVNSAFKFFEPYAKLMDLTEKNYHLAQYVLELTLNHVKFLNYPPSLIAASTIYLIKKIRKNQKPWDDSMSMIVSYEERQLKVCAKELCTLLENASEIENTAFIKIKFSQAKFHEVTKIKLERKERK